MPPFNPISRYRDPNEWAVWAWCKKPSCQHHSRLDIEAIIQARGDMPVDHCRRRLRCSVCGAKADWRTSACGPANLDNSMPRGRG